MTEPTKTLSKEWLDEPDREDFQHAGYHCLILRHEEMLMLCGYVGVFPGHVCYGKDCDAIPYDDLLAIDVHGGLTFAGKGDGKYRPQGRWWLGFDCAHHWDLVPFLEDFAKRHMEHSLGGTYRNFQYVRQEVKSLAEQIAKLDFIDWQFTWVWPLLLPLETARRIWLRRKGAA
jgi:hypothetical protein